MSVGKSSKFIIPILEEEMKSCTEKCVSHTYTHNTILNNNGISFCTKTEEYKQLENKIKENKINFIERGHALDTLKETFFAHKQCGLSIEDLRTIVNEFDCLLAVAEQRDELLKIGMIK